MGIKIINENKVRSVIKNATIKDALSRISDGSLALLQREQDLHSTSLTTTAVPTYVAAAVKYFFVPSLGGENNDVALTKAIQELYAVIAGVSYIDTLNTFGDFFLAITNIAGFYLIYYTCLRVWRAYKYWNDINPVFGKHLVEILTGDATMYDHIIQREADIIQAFSQACSVLSSMIMPAGVHAFDTWFDLASKIYCDDTHSKMQLFFFHPQWVYTTTSLTGAEELYSSAIFSGTNLLNTLLQLANDAATFRIDASYEAIRAKLYRAYLDPNGPKIGPIYEISKDDFILDPHKFELEVYFDTHVLDMVHNCDYCRVAPSAGTITDPLWYENLICLDAYGIPRQGRVTQSNGGVLYGLRFWGAFSGGSVFPTSPTSPYWLRQNGRWVNAMSYPSTEEERISILEGLFCSRFATITWGGSTYYAPYLLRSGPFIISQYDVYYFNLSNVLAYFTVTTPSFITTTVQRALYESHGAVPWRLDSSGTTVLSFIDSDNMFFVPEQTIKDFSYQNILGSYYFKGTDSDDTGYSSSNKGGSNNRRGRGNKNKRGKGGKENPPNTNGNNTQKKE